MTTNQLQAKTEDSVRTQRPNENLESPPTYGPSLPSDRDLLQDIRVQFLQADRNLADLEMRLYGAPGTVAAYRRELDSSRMALATANENYSACYESLVNEQQRLRECSQAYKNIYEQNGQMGNEMHELATTNVSLRQEVERAYRTIEASHAQNIEFEALLDNLVLTDSVTEPIYGDTSERVEARIMALEKRLKIEEKRLQGLLKASGRSSAATENLQKPGGVDGIASTAKGEQSAPTNESDNGGAWKKQKLYKGSQRKESRKPTRLTLVCN